MKTHYRTVDGVQLRYADTGVPLSNAQFLEAHLPNRLFHGSGCFLKPTMRS